MYLNSVLHVDNPHSIGGEYDQHHGTYDPVRWGGQEVERDQADQQGSGHPVREVHELCHTVPETAKYGYPAIRCGPPEERCEDHEDVGDHPTILREKEEEGEGRRKGRRKE